MYEIPPFAFNSRRSPVLARGGMVAANQPMAVSAGLSVLFQGGTAADAAVAVAGALAVVEPCSTGLGGDAFFLYYDASEQKVHGYNGSGRAPKKLSIELVQSRGLPTGAGASFPPFDALTITVPGACATWCDLQETFGALPLAKVLEPAIHLATDGFAPGPVTSHLWQQGVQEQLEGRKHSGSLLIHKSAPGLGQLMRNPFMARVLEAISQGGKEAFYLGWPGQRIVEAVQENNGVMEASDMAEHLRRTPDWSAPISTEYRGLRIFECSPNGQGLAALVALNVLTALDSRFSGPLGGKRRTHCMIEALRQGFAVARRYVADPEFRDAPLEGLLSREYAEELASGLDMGHVIPPDAGLPLACSDTVQFCVVDGKGNACSMVNSNYMGFGTGIVPEGCGFTLHNRGHNFSLDPEHPNALAPGKRPYHTIIPAMAVWPDGSLHAAFGVMGAFMQPQGHVQVLVNMLDHGLDPQAALDAPRFCLLGSGDGAVALERGVATRTRSALNSLGHATTDVSGYDRSLFGRGQIILRNPATGILMAGSDPRGDGCALGL